jgi:hypothetical protein
MLFHEAAGAAAGASESGDETETGVGQAMRSAAFECVQAGISLIAEIPTPVLDRQQLEAAFWTAAPRNTGIALACLKRLLLHPDLKAGSRQAIVIEGSRLALARNEPGDVERALGLAKMAAVALPGGRRQRPRRVRRARVRRSRPPRRDRDRRARLLQPRRPHPRPQPPPRA